MRANVRLQQDRSAPRLRLMLRGWVEDSHFRIYPQFRPRGLQWPRRELKCGRRLRNCGAGFDRESKSSGLEKRFVSCAALCRI